MQFQQYQQLSKQLQQLIDDITNSKQQEEYLTFQFNELEKAQLNNPDEQDELEQKIQELSHVEDIKSALFGADSILNADEMGIDNLLRQASNHLHNIESVYPDASELAERIDSSRIELQDIAHDISVKAERVDFDPEEFERMNNRIDTINSLEQKYHVNDLASLIETKQNIEEQLNNISHGDEEVEELQKKVQQQHDKCQQLAAQLTTRLPDITYQRLHDASSPTLQAPAALDEAAVDMSKGEEGQRFAPQFHLHRGGGEHVYEQGVVE